jgi:LPS-assembly protein
MAERVATSTPTRRVRIVAATILLLGQTLPSVALAQSFAPAGGASALGPVAPIQRDQPVFYQADRASYDRANDIATLSGHVELWQADRVLMADTVTYDRRTDVAAARGHVVLLEPGGQVVFSDYAELSDNMKNGVLKDLRATLEQGGKLAANGGERVDGRLNELSRAVYSTCPVCAQHPERAPLWDISARDAIQDLDNKRIEYRDATIDIYGVPVFWLPYLTHPDPSQKRASGLLVPSFGYSKALGAFTEIPYFWAIDAQQDATLTPIIASNDGPALDFQYRRAFNDGRVTVNGSVARYKSGDGGDINANGSFAINDTWRWGFDLERASSANYVRDFKIQDLAAVLTSQLYIEGFGQGSYAHLETRFFQGLATSQDSSKLPFVLPYGIYDYVGEPDALGGRLGVRADAFNLTRDEGTNTQRGRLSLNWDRPFVGALGDLWTVTLHMDSAVYHATKFNEQPNYGAYGTVNSEQALPTAAVMLRWPFARDAGSWGTQVIEPMAQLIIAPNASSYLNNTRIPNEDSLDLDFTDANLFALNRFAGIDRLEGGPRANLALHGAWYSPAGTFDALVGEGFRLRRDDAFPVGSGLENTQTDIVSHVSWTPSSFFDVTSRQRFDHSDFRLRYADALATVGTDTLRVFSGYIYSWNSPYGLYDNPPGTPVAIMPRNEVTAGASTHLAGLKLSGYLRQDVALDKPVSAAADASWENSCFIFDVNFARRYTSLGGDHGATTILFQITFKTVGAFGFNAS